MELLLAHRDDLRKMTIELYKHETLTSEEIIKIFTKSIKLDRVPVNDAGVVKDLINKLDNISIKP